MFNVTGTQLWTAPGSVADVVAYLESHPPAGLTRACCGSPLTYQGDDGARQLQFHVSRDGGRVSIRVVADASWRPVRSTWSYARGTVLGVDAVVLRQAYAGQRNGAPTIRRTLTGPVAQRLVTAFNSLPAQGVYSGICPAPAINARDTFLFRTDQSQVRVVVDLGCGNPAFVTEPGRPRRIGYVVGTQLDRITLHALGLPQNYGVSKH